MTQRQSRRLTIRLDEERLASLRRRAEENGSDVSQIVRDALDLLPADSAPRMRRSLPDEILALVPFYLGFADGSVKEERNRQYKELLAASFATKNLFPRSHGVVEAYEGLLALSPFFGLE